MTPLERILSTPLKIAERGGMSSIRVAADSFHVATISAGMNDQPEYAQMFAASPDLFTALQHIDQMPLTMANDADSLRHSARAMQLIARIALAKARGKS